MPKKTMAHVESANLPKSFADPKFDVVRKLLLESSRTLDKYWKKTNVAKFFDGMSEDGRNELAPFCMEWYQFLRKNCPNEYQDRLPSFFPADATVQHAFLTIKVAILACGSRAEAQKVFREVGASFVEEAVEKVLRSRKPEWASDFLLFIARLPRLMHLSSKAYWRIYRQLVNEKIAEPISDEFWVRTMFSSGMTATGLKNDPGLLEFDIWALFEFSSFPSGWSLTSCDNGNGWKNAFVSLITEGRIDKRRVLDGCFQSISKPFSDHQSKWYVQLLERIPLDETETHRESQRFFDLMNHSNPTPRSLGMKVFEKRFNAGLLDDKTALEYVPAILRESVKTKAKIGIAILDEIAGKNKTLRSQVMQAAVEGLLHENQEIQQSSLELILKHGGFADRAVEKNVQKISPSLPASLRKMIPDGDLSKDSFAATKRTNQISSPLNYVPITSVQNFEELLDLAARLVEGFKEIDDVERFLDGLARLGTDKPADFVQKTAPLLERTKKLIASMFLAVHPENRRDLNENKFEYPFGHCPFDGREIILDLRFAVTSWIIGELPSLEPFPKPVRLEWSYWHPHHRSFTHFIRHGEQIWYSDNHWTPPANQGIFVMSNRIETVAKSVCTGKTVPLLSTPTHQGGWIDPVFFVQRLLEAKTNRMEHADSDKALALSRLTPENRLEALKTFEDSKPAKNEWADVVRYALGAEKVKIGKTPHYWIAAARCRTPLDDIPALENAFPGYGPDAGVAATYRLEVKKIHSDETLLTVPEPDIPKEQLDLTLFPLLALHSSPHHDYRERDGLFQWFLSIWPRNLDPAIAVSISSHSQNIDKNYDYGFYHALKAIVTSSPILRPIAVSALFLGIGMKCTSTFTTATDTAIATIKDGRLTPELAIGPIHDLLALNFLTLSRWIKPLKTIAEQSGQHAIFVHQLLEEIVESIPAKDVGEFLELLYELGVSLNVKIKSESCRRFLGTLSGSGKAGKPAKKLLELK